MSDLEQVLECILIVVYGVMFYIAGKSDLLTLIPKMLQERFEESENCGEWLDDRRCSLCGYEADVDKIGFNCSCQQRVTYKTTPYCPICGAKMDGKESES